MLQNYLKVSWRNLLRNKFNNTLNVIGLTLGVTCFLIIYAKVNFESSFDGFHSESDRIYRVVRVTSGLTYLEGDLEYRTGVNLPLPNAIKQEIPELESVSQMFYFSDRDVRVRNEGGSQTEVYRESGISFVEPSFFNVLDFRNSSFEWIIGNPETSLSAPFSVVLSEPIARKYFGSEDPIGKQLEFIGSTFTVTGLISDLPENTDFPFQILGSLASAQKLFPDDFRSWGGLSDNFYCLLKIREGTSPQSIEEKINQVHAANTSEETAAFRKYELQPLSEIHHDQRFGNYNNHMISNNTIFALLSIGLLLIAMACINYSNLSITQLTSRGKTVGIKKILGNTRSKLILQQLSETLLLSLVSTAIGFGIATLIVRNFATLIGIPASWVLEIELLLIIPLIALVVSITAGIYPALLISKINPVVMIRNKGFGSARGSSNFSKWMVTFQFVIAQILIVCGVVIFQQLDFIESKDLGYDRNNILVVDLPSEDQVNQNRFEQNLLQNPYIRTVSFSSVSPGREGNFLTASRQDGSIDVRVDSEEKSVDESYIDTYGLRLLSGTNFNEGMKGSSIIVNQKLVEELLFESVNEITGSIIQVNGRDATVVGVVENFHSASMYDPIRPCLLRKDPEMFDVAGIRFNISEGENLQTQVTNLLSGLEAKYEIAYPNEILEYQFFDDAIAAYYEGEKRIATMVHIFTIVMIVICCLGIIGLIHYTTTRRAKEVAVRKVIGATVSEVARILIKNFAEWVIIANVIAWPIAYFLMESWLQNFSYQIGISWWIFLLSGMIAFVIAILTVSYHIISAARVNPASVLRNE